MESIEAAAFDLQGKLLATAASDGMIKLYDAAAGRHIMTLQGHTHHVLSVAFSPDGNRLASSSVDGSVRIWDTTTGRETLRLRGDVIELAFSPDGRRLAGANRLAGSFAVWDLTVQEHTSDETPSTNATGDVRSTQ